MKPMACDSARRRWGSLVFAYMGCAMALLLTPTSASAWEQDSTQIAISRDIQQSRIRLEQIRAERERLQGEMSSIQAQAASVSGELSNIERQLSASRSVVAEIDFQIEASTRWHDEIASELIRTREQVALVRTTLNHRLREIYKGGPLHAVRVLLGADSFGDLLLRYRYLKLISDQDRRLVSRVEELRSELIVQASQLEDGLRELDRLRGLKSGETRMLESVERDRRRTLESFRTREGATQDQMDALREGEVRLQSLVGNLESSRLSGGGIPDEGTGLTGSERGSLLWPVDGEITYEFGPRVGPGGTNLRWNGLGISASRGSPVRAVHGGVVALAGPFEGYGPTVVVSHGEGFYSLYLYLEDVGVVEGRAIEAGQVVGTVGGQDTPEGPHIELQIRVPSGTGAPEAVDPLQWLVRRNH